jgi:hypothetical protein
VSYITTDGQSASMSWCQAPIWGLWPDYYYCQTIAVLLTWASLSDERSGLSFTMYNVQYIYILHVILRYSHTLSLSLSLSFTHTHTHTLSLSLSLSLFHTHTHTHTLTLTIPLQIYCIYIAQTITPRHGPRRGTPFTTVPLLLRVDSLLRERVYRAVA